MLIDHSANVGLIDDLFALGSYNLFAPVLFRGLHGHPMITLLPVKQAGMNHMDPQGNAL